MEEARSVRLQTKLMLGFTAPMLLVLLVGTLVFLQGRASSRADEDVTGEYRKTLLAQQIVANIDSAYFAAWAVAYASDAAAGPVSEAGMAKSSEAGLAMAGELQSLATTARGKQFAAELDQAARRTIGFAKEVSDLAEHGKGGEAKALLHREGGPIRGRVEAIMGELGPWRQGRMVASRTTAAAHGRHTVWLIVGGSILVVILTAGFAVSFSRKVSRPLVASRALLGRVNEGDLTGEIDQTLLARRDEAGELASVAAGLGEMLRVLLLDIVNGAGTLHATSEGLGAVSAHLATGAKIAAERTQAASVAAEESSTNTASVAAAMEAVSINLASVASAAEEMSSTVGEIAANSERARATTERAKDEVRTITSTMEQLGQAAREIDKVTETITLISSQTNLLALNATIEAARAGVAGKGFAVVANEIKELAHQTSIATEDIKARIASVQTSAGNSIGSIEAISGVIAEVRESVSSIATAIEEQSAVTKDVASSIAQASLSIKEANQRVTETAAVSKSMAEDIARVSQQGEAMSRDASIVEADIATLRAIGGRLGTITSGFQLGQRAIDFGEVKKGHIRWRGKLIEMFEGQQALTENSAKNHHACAFGLWYEGEEGHRFRDAASFNKLGAKHQAFHAMVAEIVQAWNSGNEKQALAQYQRLLSHTVELFALLDQLAIDGARVAA